MSETVVHTLDDEMLVMQLRTENAELRSELYSVRSQLGGKCPHCSLQLAGNRTEELIAKLRAALERVGVKSDDYWTPKELASFQDWFDAVLKGNGGV